MSKTIRATGARPWLLILWAGLAVSGCASLRSAEPAAAGLAAAAAAAASAPAASAPASAPAASGARAGAPAPGAPQPFASVIKDAHKVEGLFTLWQKDEKVWIELRPADLGRPYFLSPKIVSGLGEAGLYGGSMASRWRQSIEEQIVEFRRIHNQVQLIARNTEFVARAGTPEGRAVEAGFSPSLLASAAVASQPHPESKAVLVEANALFLGDLLGLAQTLQRSYRQNYGLDARNSAIVKVRGKPDAVVFETLNHYATASIAQPLPGVPSGAPTPSAPRSLPDARSMFFGLHYSLSRLPAEPMRPRAADPRVGHFTTVVQDFSDDLARTPKLRWVNRWRLEKQDPQAALSPPVKPITYWLDRNIPEKYREAIGAGVLEWNKAFEKIGFKDAIVVRQQPDDTDFDTLDVDVASIRWMTNSSPSFGAIGPSHVDPRSGEILDADIGMESLSSRSVRALRSQILSPRLGTDWAALMQAREAQAEVAPHGTPGHRHDAACDYADQAAEQLSYALDVLEARGELDPASPEAQQFVLDYLKDTTMHEVGHTLGLRHNFRSSRVYSDRQLSDPEFTRSHGLAGSVMEYAPINLGRPGEPGGTPFQLTLGPYDYWAIEYAYRPLPADTEGAELARIAARSAEPELAYGTDEDNMLGVDPETLHFDLGDDVVVFASKRLEIARDLLKRQSTRSLKPSEDYAVLRRSVAYALRDAGRAVGVLARQIGGLRTLRDFPGSGRDPLVPVPAAVQRAALDVLARGLLAADSLSVPASLQRRLAPDFQERGEALFAGEAGVATDFAPQQAVVEMQRVLLVQLMSDGVATRLLDSEAKVSEPGATLRLSELYRRLSGEIWSELDRPGPIPALRRELQREHLNRLTAQLLRPGGLSRVDARSLLRSEGRSLLARLEAASRRAGTDAETRAHLLDSTDSLRLALNAALQRAGA